MNLQRKNSAHHFRMQSEREQTLVMLIIHITLYMVNGTYFLVRTCVLLITDWLQEVLYWRAHCD